MDAHQCPRCELRFVTRPELEEHLHEEHGVPRAGEEPEPEPDPDRDAPPAT